MLIPPDTSSVTICNHFHTRTTSFDTLLTLPYLWVGRLVHLPSAEAVSVWPNVHPQMQP